MALLTCAASAGASETIGYVLRVEGKWSVAGAPTLLAVGQEVPAGAALTVQAPSSIDAITIIARKTGAVLVSLVCKDAGACAKPVRLPEAVAETDSTGTVGALFDMAMDKLKAHPDRYVAHISRSLEPPLHDEALKLSGAQLDMEPVFSASRPGTYTICLRPMHDDTIACDALASRYTYLWDITHPVQLSTPGLRPGLYELVLLHKAADGVEYRGSSAWVRVVGAGHYDPMAAAFHQLNALTTTWGEQVDASARRAVQRAWLDSVVE
jgi:hypothetical protein